MSSPLTRSGFPTTWRDRRSSGRRTPAAPVDLKHPTIAATVRNRSRDGLAVETGRGLPVGGELVFELVEPFVARLRLRVAVRWCRLARIVERPDGDRAPRFLAGLEILESESPESRNRSERRADED